ncbi:hypothetical protein ACFOZY_01230 [Chungangia koreensis]|uniref:Uncharacterized protein n=1 Tax=Chungangia koreensis TaxID=752657 RepID=A0ABV8X0N7_9LACT
MKKIIAVGSLIVLLVIAFQYYITLKGQTALPSEGWSRPYSIDVNPSNYNGIQSVSSEDGQTISLVDLSKSLTVLNCDDDMVCEENRKFEKIDTYKNTWSDHSNTYYIQNEKLMHWNEGDEQVIAEPVADFMVSEQLIYYWNNDNEVSIADRNTLKVNAQFKADQTIYSIETDGQQIFVVLKDIEGSKYTVHLYDGELIKLFEFPIRQAEALLDVKIVADEGYQLLLQKQVTEGGGRTISYYTAPFDHLKSEPAISLKKLKFTDAETGAKLLDVINAEPFYGKDGPRLTFSAAMFDPKGEKVHKIYTADYDKDAIVGTAVTKKGGLFSRPLQINDDTILFLKLDAKDRYLNYASAKKEKLAESSGIMEGDFKASAYQLITLMMNGIMLLLLSIIWLLPGLAIVYSAQSIWRRFSNQVPYKSLVAVYVIALLIFQVFGFFKMMNEAAIIYNIPFITQPWQLVALHAISMVLTLLPLLIAKMKVTEDEFNTIILYTTLMNLTTLFLLIGPYIL